MGRSRFVFFLLLVPIKLFAQTFTPDPDWRFVNFNGQNHFVSREIADVTVDKKGYVWTCGVGVQRFDGYKTLDFNSVDHEKGALRTNYSGVMTDHTGRVWVTSAGICYYDDASGKFIYLSDGKRNLSNVGTPYEQGGYLWFICELGLAKLNLKTLIFSYTSLTTIADPLAISLINDSTMLISSREKIFFYNIKNDTYTVHTFLYNHLLVKIFAITQKENIIFLATNYGLFKIDNVNHIKLKNCGLANTELTDLLFLPADHEKKYLFFATDGKGMMVYNTVSNRVEFAYTHDDNNPFSLPENIISKLYADTKGRLWMATDMGISMLDLNNQQFKMRIFNKNDNTELGLSKIAPDKFDSSRVWMSSYNRGMIRVNWKTQAIEQIFNKNAEMQRIYDFVQVNKNKWLIATQKKILEWGPETGITRRTALPLGDSLAIICNIRYLIPADANNCFITTNKGLFKYDIVNHQITIASMTGSKRDDETRSFILLNGFYDNGKLWIASRNGLFNYDIAKKTTIIYGARGNDLSYFFFDIAKAINNQIVCAAGKGLYLFNTASKKYTKLNPLGNIFNPLCVSAIGAGNKAWAGTEAGILTYDFETRQLTRAFDETSMMQAFASTPFALIGNNIVFGVRNGYAYFAPGLKTALKPSDPVIEGVNVNNQPVTLPVNRDKDATALTFSHTENSINIAFTAFLYNNPDYVKFRYRLRGSAAAWQYAEDQRSANFAQLEPGDYTFYVQSGNKNGTWNSHLASISFIIQPPYWETWWFRALVILLIGFGLYQLYLYRVKNILAIERIRERIASDFHDDIGSALSSISIFSEVADQQLKQQTPSEETREIVGHIALQSRAMLDAMDDIIWAVNPQNDHLNDLAVRMHEFAVPLLEAKNIHFNIDIDEEILNTQLKMDSRKNIFLIFKECINNIVKHSCCTTMGVTVKRLGNHLEMTILDDGKGFDVNALSTRNGLKNIQKRATEINGAIQVRSESGKGTVTTLVVNII